MAGFPLYSHDGRGEAAPRGLFYKALIPYGFTYGSVQGSLGESTCNVGDMGSIPGTGRSLEEGNGKALQYSCLENPMDRGA